MATDGRRRPRDPARRAAFELLRLVDERGAYANLALPDLIAERQLDSRDAALATELSYGTLRAAGTLDAIVALSVGRALEPAVRDVLRLGAYQLLRTRIPPHAAVSASVELARAVGLHRASGLVNAVLRRVAERTWEDWTARLAADLDPIAAAAVRHAHPTWIAQAFADALGGTDDLDAALAADDERPQTHLVAWPGLLTREELIEQTGGRAAPYSPYGVHLEAGGRPGDIPAISGRRAAVQDEGSQLCAIAAVTAPVDGRDERWLDLCAGPGGKAALLAALAAARGAHLTANELRPHRAELVRRATAGFGDTVSVEVGDARGLTAPDGGYDRVLLDAPCTGLGALRRRPEARWRRTPDDLADLTALQRELLDAAVRLTRPGGVIVHIVCSPHPAETREQIAATGSVDVLDARPLFPGVPDLGDGPTVQLWPHRHGTDAMFCAVLRRRQS